MAFTYRLDKGSPLTEQELDDNFREVANIAQITADEINKKVTADTNEAKKQANEAAKQALKAKTEADRASQITGLDTVADAIGFAAVPFPDVWIPFNDSLRMIAGFGRDVKVGSDVVATYVNYERATTSTYIDKSGVLRTAAINEPRFEKQGLLIEGQSTNIVPRSTNFSTTNTGYSRTLVASLSGDNDAYLFTGTGESGANINTAITCTIDKPTFSFYIKVPEDSTTTLLNLLIRNSTDAINLNTATYKARDGEVVKSGGGGTWISTYIADGWYRVVHVFDSATTPSLNGKVVAVYLGRTGAGSFPSTDKYIIYGFQVESLPFASSYIPTNGAAVTRAADKCWIVNAGNSNVHCGVYTISCDVNISTIGINARIIDLDNSGGSDRQWVFVNNQEAPMLMGRIASVNAGPLSIGPMVGIVADGQSFKTFSGGRLSQNAITNTVSSASLNRIVFFNSNNFAVGNSYGHIRNLRIWHQALSDAQIKGLK